MMTLKKMLIKRAVKKKINKALDSMNKFAADVQRDLKKFEKRIPVKVTIK